MPHGTYGGVRGQVNTKIGDKHPMISVYLLLDSKFLMFWRVHAPPGVVGQIGNKADKAVGFVKLMRKEKRMQSGVERILCVGCIWAMC